MKYAVISGEYDFVNSLLKYGITPLKTADNKNLQMAVSFHADMNCLCVGKKIFVLSQQQKLINEITLLGYDCCKTDGAAAKYPEDVRLNAAICGKTAIINAKTIDKDVYSELVNQKYKIYEVRQGYTGCSTLFVNEKAVITADDGIYDAIHNEIDTLKISAEDIALPDFSNGFAGGCAKMIAKDKMLFFGDVTKHRDFEKIESFLQKYDVSVAFLQGKLTDIGGMILLPEIID